MMTSMIEDILVLLFVAAAGVYMIVRLRRMATGQSTCACGTKTCGAPPGSCPSGVQSADAACGPSGQLPLLPPSCNQGECGCGKS